MNLLRAHKHTTLCLRFQNTKICFNLSKSGKHMSLLSLMVSQVGFWSLVVKRNVRKCFAYITNAKCRVHGRKRLAFLCRSDDGTLMSPASSLLNVHQAVANGSPSSLNIKPLISEFKQREISPPLVTGKSHQGCCCDTLPINIGVPYRSVVAGIGRESTSSPTSTSLQPPGLGRAGAESEL